MRAASFFAIILGLALSGGVAAQTPEARPAPPEGGVELTTDQARGLARQAMATGNLALADAISGAILRQNPDDAEMLLIRAILARRAGATEVSLEAAEDAYNASDIPALRFDAAFLIADLLAREEKFLRSELWLRRADQTAATPQQEAAVEAAFRQVSRANPLSIQLRFAVTPSDNVNNGAEELIIDLGGIPFRVSDEDQALSGIETDAGLSLSYRLSESETQRTEALLNLFYRDVRLDSDAEDKAPEARDSDFDYGVIIGGLRHQRLIWPDTGPTSFTGLFGQSWYGQEDLARWLDLSAAQTVVLESNRAVTFGISGRAEKRLDESINDSDQLALSVDYREALEGGGNFGVNASLRNVWSDSRTIDRTGTRLTISGGFGQFGAFEPSASLTLENRNYHRFTSVEGGRKDQTVTLNLRATLPDVRLYGFVPEFTARKSRTHSTVDIYDRESFSFGINAVSRF